MAQADSQIFDRGDMLERLGGDEELVAEIVSLYLEEREHLVEAVRRSAGTADLEGLARAAHSLRGTLLNVSAPRAAAVATELEHAAREQRSQATAELIAQLETEIQRLQEALSVAGFAGVSG